MTRRTAISLLSASSAPLLAAEAPPLCFEPARSLADLIRRKKLSARELLEAHLKQIERVNPKVNAIVTLVADQALAKAKLCDEAAARGRFLGPLHGLPVAHKDLQDTKGIRTTYGSPIFKDHVPAADTLLVHRIREAGAVTLGKTNTPEFGAGSQTFNPVFGATKNPHDLSKTCGGSSGGAAVSLACGMVPIADGSDTGGSLRNPASFCGVGRIPHLARPRAARPDRFRMEHHQRSRSDGAQRRRLRIFPERNRRTRRARAHVDPRRRRPVRQAVGPRLQRHARRMVQGPRRHSPSTAASAK
jgi:amidase